jgi:hypothetical protein
VAAGSAALKHFSDAAASREGHRTLRANRGGRLRQAASLLVEGSAAHAQGMSSSRCEAGHRLTSLVSTSVK